MHLFLIIQYSFDIILQERSSHEGEYSVVSFKFSDNVMLICIYDICIFCAELLSLIKLKLFKFVFVN